MPMKRIAFIALIALALLVAPLTVQAQTPEPSSPPRTAYGRPDLQGVWDFRTITPLQRPAAQGDKAVLTAEEAAAFEASACRVTLVSASATTK